MRSFVSAPRHTPGPRTVSRARFGIQSRCDRTLVPAADGKVSPANPLERPHPGAQPIGARRSDRKSRRPPQASAVGRRNRNRQPIQGSPWTRRKSARALAVDARGLRCPHLLSRLLALPGRSGEVSHALVRFRLELGHPGDQPVGRLARYGPAYTQRSRVPNRPHPSVGQT